MGIMGMMRTSVSGMNAQSNRLSTIADNVANTGTAGYKRADTEFSTLVLGAGRTSYESGSVMSHIRYDITKQGTPRVTGRNGDVMIDGAGFFRVCDEKGAEFMTRAGSFERTPDGFLRNTAGFYLLDANGQRVQIKGGATDMIPPETTTKIDMGINLKASEKVPVKKMATWDDLKDPSTYNQKKSVTCYDKEGKAFNVDLYFIKDADDDDSWKVYAVREIDGKLEPYSFKPNGSPDGRGVLKLKFNPDGTLKSSEPAGKIQLVDDNNTPGLTDPIDVNLFDDKGNCSVTQQGDDYAFVIKADGMTAGYFKDFTFSNDGEVMVTYTNGKSISKAIVGMATVQAPDQLTVVTGTVFQANHETGAVITGRAGEGPFGTLNATILEESNADIGSELTAMIESQRNYTANSKVFQAGSELMDVIVNLKR